MLTGEGHGDLARLKGVSSPEIGANEVRAHARLRARAEVVATKLGIILLLSSSVQTGNFN